MKNWKKSLALFGVSAVALAVVVPARAGPVTYADFNTWSAAVGMVPIGSVTIPDPDPDQFVYFGNGDASVTYSNITFSQSAALSDGAFYNIGFLFSGSPAVLSSQDQSFGVANIRITLSAPAYALALNLGYDTFGANDVTFALSNGQTVTQGSTGSGYAAVDFFGVTDDTPFNSVLVTTVDSVLALNNVEYATANTVTPEPASHVMMALGISGLWFAAIKRSRGR